MVTYGHPQAYERFRATDRAEVNAGAVTHTVLLLQALDLTSIEAKPIVDRLRENPRALRYVLDHPLKHLDCIGYNTGTICAVSPIVSAVQCLRRVRCVWASPGE